jgi:SAM-dependent methyltransferase
LACQFTEVSPIMPPSTLRNTDTALSFREYFGLRTINRLALRPGMRALQASGPSDGIRIPRPANVEWELADIRALPNGHARFDVVVSAFSIHHASDMTATSRRLWELVRAGGRLLVATWSERLFEPANAVFWDTVHHVRPSLWQPFQPWNAIDTPELLADMLEAAGIPGGQVAEERYAHRLSEPEDWWTIVMNSHYRRVVDQLAPYERDAVELLTLRHVTERQIERITAGALFAVARK